MKRNYKKNNKKKKGFTLVELLAVIIILAIVVGITIPAVLTTTNKAKEKAFQTSAKSVAEWVDRQYEIYRSEAEELGIATLDENFKALCIRECDSTTDYIQSSDSPNNCNCDNRVVFLTAEFIQAAGLKSDNINTTTHESFSTAKYRKTIRTKRFSNVIYSMQGTQTTTDKKLGLSGTYNHTRVFINPDTGRSCVTLRSAGDSDDYPTDKITCGGACQSSTTNRADYCKAT